MVARGASARGLLFSVQIFVRRNQSSYRDHHDDVSDPPHDDEARNKRFLTFAQ
jgi:hypothetical protein